MVRSPRALLRHPHFSSVRKLQTGGDMVEKGTPEGPPAPREAPTSAHCPLLLWGDGCVLFICLGLAPSLRASLLRSSGPTELSPCPRLAQLPSSQMEKGPIGTLAGDVMIRGSGRRGHQGVTAAPGSRHKTVMASGLGATRARCSRSSPGLPRLCIDFSGAPAPRCSSKVALPARHRQNGCTPLGGEGRWCPRCAPARGPAQPPRGAKESGSHQTPWPEHAPSNGDLLNFTVKNNTRLGVTVATTLNTTYQMHFRVIAMGRADR
ncbi:hypothetical protein NDU88_001808 [Pleurodeles waltl]|uniref:Uncharacterized protein n=1 Tax=Pleurodeles waltl TaxID=8319 RepID=A0AAV7MLZ7_PLEWA|nr:hypothetical protein NDU88_001808 [Pleurodeles waltl]